MHTFNTVGLKVCRTGGQRNFPVVLRPAVAGPRNSGYASIFKSSLIASVDMPDKRAIFARAHASTLPTVGKQSSRTVLTWAC